MVIMSLKTALSGANARKIFGRKEIGIMLKQMSGIGLTQSEKNRLSRDIRPKLEFIKEISGFKDEFRLEKNQNNKRLMQKAVATILSDNLHDKIEAILLFGSFADNTFTPGSDIDICVVFNENISPRDATKFRIRISGELPEKLDIQAFNTLPQKVKRDIARNHKVLYMARGYDNLAFSIKHLKDEDYFIRAREIFGVQA